MTDAAQVERTYRALTKRFGPVGRTLSRLIRPTFVAPKGKVFVWADWSAIEARVCPWLADTRGANEVVDIFRVNDADPSSPDIYMMDAGEILHKDPSEVTKKERNAYGKVSRLSLAYLGGKGALFGMARNYGASFTEDEAQDIIDKWRAKNRWAMDFGYAMWDAALWCMANPGDAREVGRITFYYNPAYLRGTLFMVLPDGTWLSYPSIRWEERERKDKMTGKVETKTQLTYRSGRARVSIWAGIFCLSGETEVATDRGWARLDSITAKDRIWDGVAWVAHEGLCFKGYKHTIPLNGVEMTPNHRVLTTEGWKDASQCEGLDGAAVRLPDGYSTSLGRADEGPEEVENGEVAVSVRLRIGSRQGRVRGESDIETQRVHFGGSVREEENQRGADDTRDVESRRLHSVAERASSLPSTEPSVFSQLRRAGDHSGPVLGDVRGVLGGHGANLEEGADAGACGQRGELRAAELRMGDDGGPGTEPARQLTSEHQRYQPKDGGRAEHPSLSLGPRAVYDLINCGPRSRFVVRGDDGQPFIVHNCNNSTQGTAACLLRHALVTIDRDARYEVILTTHDEMMICVDEAEGPAAAAYLVEVMSTPPEWAPGLPLAVEATIESWYTKTSG